ncbi:MAG TPA: hypothetical protein VFQ76_12995, partial [Longimicrobiaceae bacterium]|nr:hypothetical protein [Longimicrobiaceae bacterium]
PARAGAALPWLSLGLGALAGLAVPGFLALVVVLGRNIPQPAMGADYLAGLLWAAALGLGILLWPVPDRDRRALLVLWGAKCFVTLGFMLFYEYSYGLDSYLYFEESINPLRPSADVNPALGGGGTELIAVLSWYHNRLLPDSYHALKVSYSMLGLVAVYLFYRAAGLAHPLRTPLLLYFVGLFPSVLFWSSVLGKDPLVLLGISLYVLGTVGLARRGSVGYVVPLVVGIFIAAAVRTWLGPILLLPLVWLGLRGIRGVFRKTVFLGVIGAALVVAIGLFRERLAIRAWQDVYSVTEGLSEGWEGGSAQEVEVEFNSIGSMLAFLPSGSFRALFRPLPGEVMNPFGMLAGIENLFLLGLVALAVVNARLARLGEPLVQWAILLVVVWASLYGFVSSNLGAAVRFKLQVLPLMLILLLYLAAKRRVEPVADGTS